MAELTKEHFDEVVKNLATKTYVGEGFQKLEDLMEARFEEVLNELDLSARVFSLEKRLERLEQNRIR